MQSRDQIVAIWKWKELISRSQAERIQPGQEVIITQKGKTNEEKKVKRATLVKKYEHYLLFTNGKTKFCVQMCDLIGGRIVIETVEEYFAII